MRRQLRFEFAFQCPDCNTIVEGTTFLAMVKGDGAEWACSVCALLFVITDEGATPIRPEMINKLAGMNIFPQPASQRVITDPNWVPPKLRF